MAYKTLPLDKSDIEQMQISAPDKYDDLVMKFGEENVINNLLVEYVVLTEDKNTVRDKDNQAININRELINKVRDVNNSAFQVYLKAPINALKSWIVDGDATLGYTPIILNHDKVQSRQGYVLGGSYRTIEIDGKLHLTCKAVLISPEAKYNYINGLYREISPTINGNYIVPEISYVNVPAQLTNTSLSATQSDNLVKITTAPIIADDWVSKIEKAKADAAHAEQEAKIKQKESIAANYTNMLLQKGVIVSAQRKEMNKLFVQLSAGDERLVANALLNVKKSPLHNKPRQVFLQGNMYMNKSIDERFLEFSKENASKFPSGGDLRAAFEKHEATLKVQLSAGNGEVSDPMEDIMGKLTAMKESGMLSDEHKKALCHFCAHEEGAKMSLSTANAGVGDNACAPDAAASLAGSEGGKADGKVEDAGGVDTPNNTSLSAADTAIKAQSDLVEVLQTGFNAKKTEAENLLNENNALKAQLSQIKSTLGVA